MPTIVPCLLLDGDPLEEGAVVLDLTLSMSLHGHHLATVRVGASDQFQRSRRRSPKLEKLFQALGKRAELHLNPLPDEDQDLRVIFKGFVGGATHEVRANGERTVALTILSASAQLDGGPRCHLWEKRSVKEIVEAVIGCAPLVVAETGTLPTAPVPYEAQFEESDYAFLKRLAGRFSYWMYDDGETLHFSKTLQGQDTHRLSLAHDNASGWLEYFAVEARVLPAAFEQTYFLPGEKREARADHTATTIESSNDYVRLAAGVSRDVYSRPVHPPYAGKISSENDLRDQAICMAQSWGRSLVVVRGRTTHPGLRPGSQVTVAGGGIGEDGPHVVSEVTHRYRSRGGYVCEVELIPADMAFPPVFPPPPATRLQRAQVIDKYDSKSPGMVKVRYSRAVDGDTDEGSNNQGDGVTTWVRVLTAEGGEKGGLVALPEPGDEVVIGHVGGRATHPVILGCVYNPSKKSPVFDEIQQDIAKNDGKAFLTKSGNLLLVRDAPGKETIELRSPKGDNLLKLTMDNGAQIVIETEGLVRVQAKKTVTIESQGDMTLDSKGKLTIKSTGDMSLTSQAGLTAHATQRVKISGAAGSEVTGAQVGIKGQALVSVEGALVKIN